MCNSTFQRTNVMKTQFKSVKAAVNYLSQHGYKNVGPFFWYLPNTNYWAIFSMSKMRIHYLCNVTKNGKTKAEVMQPLYLAKNPTIPAKKLKDIQLQPTKKNVTNRLKEIVRSSLKEAA